jgi:DNA-binding transcriptional regulator PaaX
MSLKPNTYKLFTFLYSPDTEFFATSQQIQKILPELSESGRRSLLSYLTKQNLISSEKRGTQAWFRLTHDGERQLEEVFPAFQTAMRQWNGDLVLVVFLDPPKGDGEFRYLRNFLVSHWSTAVSRGIYIWPQAMFEQYQRQLEPIYRSSLLVIKNGDWIMGDQRSFLQRHFAINDLVISYSGISKEIVQLLKLKKTVSSFSDQQKLTLYSVFHRLYSLIQKDSGLHFYYFPQVVDPLKLLTQLHFLFN